MRRQTFNAVGVLLTLVPLTFAPAAALAPVPCLSISVIVEDAMIGFAPNCIEVSSGTTVQWLNKDFGPNSDHNPGSVDADHQCFSAFGDTGSEQDSLETYEVAFAWDGAMLSAASVGGTNVCSPSSPTTYSVVNGAAQIPYECTIHDQMTGLIVVTPE